MPIANNTDEDVSVKVTTPTSGFLSSPTGLEEHSYLSEPTGFEVGSGVEFYVGEDLVANVTFTLTEGLCQGCVSYPGETTAESVALTGLDDVLVGLFSPENNQYRVSLACSLAPC